MKKITALVLMLAIALSSCTAIINIRDTAGTNILEVISSSAELDTEKLLADNLPESETLARIAMRLHCISGQREFDGIYIADDSSLIRDMDEPEKGAVASAVNSITNFVERHGQRTYLMLVPTAAVIKQQEMSAYAADSLYNQRHMISDCYQQLAGTVTTVDVYQQLFNHRSEYIYYNTEENLTGLGGYYVYEELCSRMGLRVRGLPSFSINYGGYGFFGSLAQGIVKDYAKSDIVSMYEYAAYDREYTLVHVDSDGTAVMHKGLYYNEDEVGADKTDMAFGGLSPVMEVDIVSPYSECLLVFGDDTAKAWLPFLVNHYAHVTYVDLSAASPDQLSAIDVSDYQQVMFGYSTAVLGSGAGFENLVFIN